MAVTVSVTRATARKLKRKSLSASLAGAIRDGAGTSTALTDRLTLTLAKQKKTRKRR